MENQKLSYPVAVYFILVHQILERFSYWGINVILPFFLRNILKFDDDSSTAIYHGYSVFSYLNAIIGAIVADSYLGKYKTILLFSTSYFAGTFFLTLSATELLTSQIKIISTMVGLVLTGLAAGSIKPCITAYGGDQFKLPEQQKQLDSFFPLLYLMVNLSLFVSAIVMPILRRDISCFGEGSCYSLAFSLPFVFIILATVVLRVGHKFYKNIEISGNVVIEVWRCIKTAVIGKYKSKVKRSHWLDYAEIKYGAVFIGHVKTVLNVIVIFIPVIVFWAVYEQQFSRWAFQASRMDGRIGSYEIAPDQMATLNFILTFVFIPVFEKVFYPQLSKMNMLTKPLQRVVLGFVWATLAFVVCGFVEIKIENTEEKVHMVWLLPQYILMSAAEVMLIPSINTFAYSQAPKNMKSMLLMATLIPQALGSIIVIIVAKGKLFQLQSNEFFFFAGINTCAIVALIFLAVRYKPIGKSDSPDDLQDSTCNQTTNQDKKIDGVDNPAFKIV